jgi:ankyrin repeat protein
MKKIKEPTDFSILKENRSAIHDNFVNYLSELIDKNNNQVPHDLSDAALYAIKVHKLLEQYDQALSILTAAIRTGDAAVVQDALQQGVDPNLTTKEGFTLLSYAAAAEQGKVVDLLLAHKADPAHKEKDALSALEQTAIKDNVRIFNKFARAGAAIDAPALKKIAARNQAEKMLKRLG